MVYKAQGPFRAVRAPRCSREVFTMKRLHVIGTLAAAFAACTPDIPQSTATHYVTALFDPSVSNVPTPNLLATDPKTGLLAVPLAPGASPAQADFVAA